MRRLPIRILVLLLLSASAYGQNFGPPPPQFVSPEVKDDRSIVLRLHAPEAKTVRVSSSDFPSANPFGPGVEMTKGDNGVWEATVGPVPPGAYRYGFNVDGLQVTDPRNPSTSETNMNSWSLLGVPGSDSADLKDVPHGAVAQVQYYSKSLARFRRMHVYTPPGYEGGTEKLPVLYLLHGAMDSDASWSTVGRAGMILDNLIADGKAVPMIVVMPMGHTGPFTFGPGGNLNDQMAEFAKDFVEDLRPLVEKRYRVSTERQHRAIAGLSMGGMQTLNISIADLDDYAYVGVFSSGIFGIDGGFGGGGDGPSWEEQNKDALENKDLKNGLKLFWFATGKDDFLVETTRDTVELLKKHEFDVVYNETDGGHTWLNWRDYLPQFAGQLFRHETKSD
jgi:enterochelin esterase-like enzyme